MMQFENPVQAPYSGTGAVMTSSAQYTNHQPTPFYIDNILASTTSGNEENESSATPGVIAVKNEGEQASIVGYANSSPNPGVLVHPSDGLLGSSVHSQGSPVGHVSGLHPISSPYQPVLSAADAGGVGNFLSSGSTNLQNGASPLRQNHITRPIVPTPVPAVPAHHHSILSYPNSGPYSRPNIYDPPGTLQGPYNQGPIQYTPSPYPGHSAHSSQRLDSYAYPVRHDYSWFLDRQAAFNKGESPKY